MGGVCLSLYGFIAVSGLNMIKNVDLNKSKNLFVVSSILIAGIGGLALKFGADGTGEGAVITISSIATALIIGIVVNACFKEKSEVAEGDSLPSASVVEKGVIDEPTTDAPVEEKAEEADVENKDAE